MIKYQRKLPEHISFPSHPIDECGLIVNTEFAFLWATQSAKVCWKVNAIIMIMLPRKWHLLKHGIKEKSFVYKVRTIYDYLLCKDSFFISRVEFCMFVDLHCDHSECAIQTWENPVWYSIHRIINETLVWIFQVIQKPVPLQIIQMYV
jgi:hypothetical protein